MSYCACGCPSDIHSLPDDGCINHPECKGEPRLAQSAIVRCAGGGSWPDTSEGGVLWSSGPCGLEVRPELSHVALVLEDIENSCPNCGGRVEVEQADKLEAIKKFRADLAEIGLTESDWARVSIGDLDWLISEVERLRWETE